MGVDDGISPQVRAFIIEQVDSVMQLELTLLLADRRDQSWTADDVAKELRIDPAWVDGQLRAMAARALFVTAEGSPAQFRYVPKTPDVDRTVTDLAKAYTDRRVTVIGLIFSKPADTLRSFADAFRLRKDRPDG